MWSDDIPSAVIILNCSYVLIAFALVLRDILWLRAAWTGGQVCMIVYAVLSNEPVIMAWNAIFLGINVFQVVRIFLERQDVRLSEELDDLYKKVFPLMTKHEFLKFWNSGQVRVVDNECIVRDGERQKHLYLIMDGKVNVKKGDQKVARLGKNSFFAEMSFFTNLPATASVTAEDTVKLNVWEHTRLRRFREAEPDLYIKIQSVISRDLVRKMQHEAREETLYWS